MEAARRQHLRRNLGLAALGGFLGVVAAGFPLFYAAALAAAFFGVLLAVARLVHPPRATLEAVQPEAENLAYVARGGSKDVRHPVSSCESILREAGYKTGLYTSLMWSQQSPW